MLKTRLILIGVCAVVVILLFQLPKSVVENTDDVAVETNDSINSHIESHVEVPKEVNSRIQHLRAQYLTANTPKQKNAIFADSLATLYRQASRFDSAAWFAEDAAKFFNRSEAWAKAGDDYYQAYTLALDQNKQSAFAKKAQEMYTKVLNVDPQNLEVKTKMAMTYVSSSNPMQGIMMLREVLAQDPKNELALFNMGMLSVQSGQYELAVQRLEQLVEVSPNHVQGHLLLGVALMNSGDKRRAREQFEKVKQLDRDPAVNATADSYLKDLK
jgi:outer membrane protein